MGIFESIEKLINEHGSATILKERLSLAADQYAALERKNTEANARTEAAELRIKDLEAENHRLRLDNEQLVKENLDLEKRLSRHPSGEVLADYDPYNSKRS